MANLFMLYVNVVYKH